MRNRTPVALGALLLALAALPAPAAESSAAVAAAPHGLHLLGVELGAGAGAALVTVPASLALGSWLGTLSNDLVSAALPGLAILAFVPPVAVVLSALFAAEALGATGLRAWPALWATLGVHLAVLVAAVLLGASARNLGDAALLTAAEMALLPATATGMLHWTARPQVPLLEVRF